MEQEIELLRESMANVKHVSFGKFSAYEGELAGKRMVLVLSGIGKVNAAVSTSWVIHQFAPDCVINTGSAGGLGKGLKVGDIVVGQILGLPTLRMLKGVLINLQYSNKAAEGRLDGPK